MFNWSIPSEEMSKETDSYREGKYVTMKLITLKHILFQKDERSDKVAITRRM